MEAFRDMVEADFDRVVSLNDAEVQQTSLMDRGQLAALHCMSSYAKVAELDGEVGAFLLALRADAPYANANFQWFVSRFPDFLYVDRIVVGSGYSGRGIGRMLYDQMFAFARSAGIRRIACEYNVEPPNPASRAFHAGFGFRECGRQHVAGGAKLVSLQVAET